MGVAIGWFACAGYTVCLPLTDSQSYDLVVDDGEHGLQRVAVKSTTQKCRNGKHYVVGLRTRGGNKTQTKTKFFDRLLVELLFIAVENGDRYLIPTAGFMAVNEILLAEKYSQFKV